MVSCFEGDLGLIGPKIIQNHIDTISYVKTLNFLDKNLFCQNFLHTKHALLFTTYFNHIKHILRLIELPHSYLYFTNTIAKPRTK